MLNRNDGNPRTTAKKKRPARDPHHFRLWYSMSDAITPPPAARLYTSLAQRSSSFELPREPALPSPADARRTGTPSTPTPPRANAPLIAVPITGVDSTADHAFHISTPTRAVFRGSFEFSRQSPSGSPDQSSGAMTELETKVRILASELAQKTREFEASAHSNSQLSRANQELSKQVAELTRANAEKARKLELIEMKQSDAASETGNDIDDQTLVEQRKPVLVPGLREFEQAALTLQKAYRKRQSSRSSERGGDRDAPGSPRAGIARSMTSLGSPLDRREGNVIRRSTDGGYGRNSFDTPSHANVRRSMDSVRGTDNWRHNGGFDC